MGKSRSSVSGAQFGLAVSSSVVTLTVPNGAWVAEIYVRSNPVVFTRDGATDPTATKGVQADAGEIILLKSRDECLKARFIRQSSDATMDVEYFNDLA